MTTDQHAITVDPTNSDPKKWHYAAHIEGLLIAENRTAVVERIRVSVIAPSADEHFVYLGMRCSECKRLVDFERPEDVPEKTTSCPDCHSPLIVYLDRPFVAITSWCL